MKIFTSYYGRVKDLPKNVFCVSISLSMPKDISIPRIFPLMPSWDILNEYKRTGDKVRYTERYEKEILSKFSVERLVEYLNNLSKKHEDKDICLLCYEKSSDFCHRHIVSKWLRDKGIDCKEYQFPYTYFR